MPHQQLLTTHRTFVAVTSIESVQAVHVANTGGAMAMQHQVFFLKIKSAAAFSTNRLCTHSFPFSLGFNAGYFVTQTGQHCF